MEDIKQLKREIAAKAKILYIKRKAEGKIKKKPTIPPEQHKKKGRPKKAPKLIILLDETPTPKISKPRGRKPNEHLSELLIIPKYIQDKLNKNKKDKIKEIMASQKIVRQTHDY